MFWIFNNSDLGDLILLRDPSADLFVILQSPGQESEEVFIFEYSDIVDCYWAQNETLTLHINAASTVPEYLKSVVIQNRLTPGSGVLGWTNHVKDLRRKGGCGALDTGARLQWSALISCSAFNDTVHPISHSSLTSTHSTLSLSVCPVPWSAAMPLLDS